MKLSPSCSCGIEGLSGLHLGQSIRYDAPMSTSDKSTGDERIRNLEVRLSYQDKMLSELDDVVQGFSMRVERLERKLSDLRESMNSQEIGPGDDQPPHY